MIKLSSRLQKVYDLIPKSNVVADVGCDHGYLSIALLQGCKAQKVIAMDINKGPLESAKRNFTDVGLDAFVDFRLSDGLAALKANETDTICICGMGGALIEKILSTSLEQAKEAECIILEPQSEYFSLRQFLYEQGFVILDEDIASEENKFYPIMKISFEADATKRESLEEYQLTYGPRLIEKAPKLFNMMLDKNEAEYLEIKEKLLKKLDDDPANLPIANRIEQLNHELDLIKKARGKL